MCVYIPISHLSQAIMQSSSSSSAGLTVASLTPEQRLQLEELAGLLEWQVYEPGHMEGSLQCLLEKEQ